MESKGDDGTGGMCDMGEKLPCVDQESDDSSVDDAHETISYDQAASMMATSLAIGIHASKGQKVVGGLKVDVADKAIEIRLASFQRPYMRAFWASTVSFFMAFLVWFSFAPLMTTIREDLNITKSEVGSANIASVAATIAARIVMGPLCDKFGPRRVMAVLLWVRSPKTC